MKRTSSVLLSFFLVLGTAACGGDSAPTEPSVTDCTGADSCEDLLQVQFLELFSGYYRGSPHVWIHSWIYITTPAPKVKLAR